MRDVLLRVHRLNADKVNVIHHGFDFHELDGAAAKGADVRRELGLDQQAVITAIGRFYWIKNQSALVRAFAAIAPEIPDAVLLVVGGGDSAPVRSLARSLGVDGQVRVLPARQDVPALLAATDLFVHPAIAESFGMVIIEAMAMRCPVVSTPVGIAPDVVEFGRTGLLAVDGSEHGIAAALRTALSMRDHWRAMGEAARQRSLAFSAPNMVAAYQDLYLRLLGRSVPVF
jgi:glycosyltransferase involved in cell wall biosynthesis